MIKTRLAAIMAVLCLGTVASAQQREIGPFAFVNALDSEKPTYVFLNGDSYKPKGYLSGQMTYGGRTWAGKVLLVAENEDLGRASLAIDIKPDSAPIVVAYVQERELEDGSTKREIKLRAIPSQASKKHSLSGMYASVTGTATLLVNSGKCLLKPFELTPVTTEKMIQLKPENSKQNPIEISLESPTHTIVFVYNLLDGSQKAVVFEDVASGDSGE